MSPCLPLSLNRPSTHLLPPAPTCSSLTAHRLLQRDELRRARAAVDAQFHALYHDKYLPLKGQAAAAAQEVAALQKRVVGEELKVGGGAWGCAWGCVAVRLIADYFQGGGYSWCT